MQHREETRYKYL